MEDQAKVLENGPYIIYGSPLLLKPMPKYFNFGKEAISTFPVWVQMRNVPLTLWNSMIFDKICSKLGRPLHMDKLTTQKERCTFARCLVEVDMAKELVHSVVLEVPEGGEHQQFIYYENLPRYCAQCREVGHIKENCKRKASSPSNANKPAENPIKSAKQGSQAVVADVVEGTGEGKKNQQQWKIKHPQTVNPGTEANSSSVPSENLTGTSESPEAGKVPTPTDHSPENLDIGPDDITVPILETAPVTAPSPEILENAPNPVTAPNTEQPQDQPLKQIGSEIYIRSGNPLPGNL